MSRNFSLVIDPRYASDIELIANGAFAPLTGFMDKATAESVIGKMSLADGSVWSIPVLLPVKKQDYTRARVGTRLALKLLDGQHIANLTISEKFRLDLKNYTSKVFGTTEVAHPGVDRVMKMGNYFFAGEVEQVGKLARELPDHYYASPAEMQKMIIAKGWQTVVAFQTRNPIHRAHEYLLKSALENHDGLVIHPLVGETKSDDVPAKVRLDCYEILLENYFNKDRALLAVLPVTMNYAGPREAIHHLLIRQNYGFTHMIIGRDHAGVGNYYGTFAAQELARKIMPRLRITPIFFENAAHCGLCGTVVTSKVCSHPEEQHLNLSGTKVREMLRNGELPPVEFSRPEVAQVLQKWARSAS